MQCPRCKATATSRMHRTRFERLLTAFTGKRHKRECLVCSHQWFGKPEDEQESGLSEKKPAAPKATE